MKDKRVMKFGAFVDLVMQDLDISVPVTNKLTYRQMKDLQEEIRYFLAHNLPAEKIFPKKICKQLIEEFVFTIKCMLSSDDPDHDYQSLEIKIPGFGTFYRGKNGDLCFRCVKNWESK